LAPPESTLNRQFQLFITKSIHIPDPQSKTKKGLLAEKTKKTIAFKKLASIILKDSLRI
jgi:hypothetical protein